MRKINNSHLKQFIYNMKQKYGQPLYIYRILSSVADDVTGQKSVEIQSTPIPRAVIVPDNLQRKFAYDLGYLAANKNFTYGGWYDPEAIMIMLENSDFKVLSNLVLDDYILYQGKRYQITKCNRLDSLTVISVKHVYGGKNNAIFIGKAFNQLNLTNIIGGTL